MSKIVMDENKLLSFVKKMEKFECVIDSSPIDILEDSKNKFFDLQLTDPEFKEINESKEFIGFGELQEKNLNEIFGNR